MIVRTVTFVHAHRRSLGVGVGAACLLPLVLLCLSWLCYWWIRLPIGGSGVLEAEMCGGEIRILTDIAQAADTGAPLPMPKGVEVGRTFALVDMRTSVPEFTGHMHNTTGSDALTYKPKVSVRPVFKLQPVFPGVYATTLTWSRLDPARTVRSTRAIVSPAYMCGLAAVGLALSFWLVKKNWRRPGLGFPVEPPRPATGMGLS